MFIQFEEAKEKKTFFVCLYENFGKIFFWDKPCCKKSIETILFYDNFEGNLLIITQQICLWKFEFFRPNMASKIIIFCAFLFDIFYLFCILVRDSRVYGWSINSEVLLTLQKSKFEGNAR